MPTYVYRFLDSDDTIEVQQAFTDHPLTEAVNPRSGQLAPVRKVFTPVGITFKGNGFYKTDSRGSARSTSSSSGSDSSSSSDSTSTAKTSSDSGSSSGSTSSSGSSSSSSADGKGASGAHQHSHGGHTHSH